MVNACFDAGKTTDRGVPANPGCASLSLPQRSQDEIRAAERGFPGLRRAPPDIGQFMARAFCIVYDAGGQKASEAPTGGRRVPSFPSRRPRRL